MNKENAIRITFFLLRVVAGLLLLCHGGQKLFGWFGGMPPGSPPLELMSQTGIGGILEFGGGLLVMLGLFARPAAFIVSGEMAVAFFQFHATSQLKAINPKGFWPIENGGEPAVLNCFIFLFIAAYGAGAWSLDAMIGSKKGSAG